LYSSNGAFRSPDAYADTLIATSTSTVAVASLSTVYEEVSFDFNNISLPAGVYFLCVATDDLDSYGVVFAASYSGVSAVGVTTYLEDGSWWAD
jgi:hypothetical protein